MNETSAASISPFTSRSKSTLDADVRKYLDSLLDDPVEEPEAEAVEDAASQANAELQDLADDNDFAFVGPLYSFPAAHFASDTRTHEVTNHDLLDELQSLSAKTDRYGQPCDYLEIRLRSIEISMELNRRGCIAPRFRKLRKPPGPQVSAKKDKSPTHDASGKSIRYRTVGEQTLGLDRQIIDLHWAQCSGWQGVVGRKPEYARLFKNTPFDFNVATAFSRMGVGGDKKFEWLHLPKGHDLVWEFDTLQSAATRNRFNEVMRAEETAPKRKTYMQVQNALSALAGKSTKARKRGLEASRAWACMRITREGQQARRLHSKWTGLKTPLSMKRFQALVDYAEVNTPAPKSLRLVTVEAPFSMAA